jgi:hypothetical protein
VPKLHPYPLLFWKLFWEYLLNNDLNYLSIEELIINYLHQEYLLPRQARNAHLLLS